MNREEKNTEIADLTKQLNATNVLYIADTSSISAVDTNLFRRDLFKNGITMRIAKNTLIAKAMRDSGKDFGELENVLKGTSALMFSENMKSPAQAILKFRKKGTKPALKGAYVDSAIFIGDDQLLALSTLKSKEDLVGEVIGMLLSPAQNVISALQSGGTTIAGIVKTLSEKN